MWYEQADNRPKRKKKINVVPGKSVRGFDFENSDSNAAEPSQEYSEAENDHGDGQQDSSLQNSSQIPHSVAPNTSSIAVASICDIKIDRWLIVDFAPGGGATSGRKRRLYIGKVTRILGNRI